MNHEVAGFKGFEWRTHEFLSSASWAKADTQPPVLKRDCMNPSEAGSESVSLILHSFVVHFFSCESVFHGASGLSCGVENSSLYDFMAVS